MNNNYNMIRKLIKSRLLNLVLQSLMNLFFNNNKINNYNL